MLGTSACKKSSFQCNEGSRSKLATSLPLSSTHRSEIFASLLRKYVASTCKCKAYSPGVLCSTHCAENCYQTSSQDKLLAAQESNIYPTIWCHLCIWGRNRKNLICSGYRWGHGLKLIDLGYIQSNSLIHFQQNPMAKLWCKQMQTLSMPGFFPKVFSSHFSVQKQSDPPCHIAGEVLISQSHLSSLSGGDWKRKNRLMSNFFSLFKDLD